MTKSNAKNIAKGGLQEIVPFITFQQGKEPLNQGVDEAFWTVRGGEFSKQWMGWFKAADVTNHTLNRQGPLI